MKKITKRQTIEDRYYTTSSIQPVKHGIEYTVLLAESDLKRIGIMPPYRKKMLELLLTTLNDPIFGILEKL